MFQDINFLAVATGTVFSIFLGFVWYTPILFGKTWMKELGIKEEDVDPKLAMLGHGFSVFTSFLVVLALAVIMKHMALNTLMGGICLGGVIGILFIGSTLFGNSIYEMRSWKLALINTGYRSVYLIVVGAILGVWH